MYRIRGVVRDYDWGDHGAIADILGHESPGHPEAEYWLGAHPSAPSTVDDSSLTLDELIASEADAAVGLGPWQRFGGLPFLLKILAAAGPLSIQAHPSLDQAKAGFAREEAAGIDRSAPNRNYRDDNHKPELICAITPFEAKCGFRSVDRTKELLAMFDGETIGRLRELLDKTDEAEATAGAVRWLLQLPTSEANRFATDVTEQARRLLADPTMSSTFEREVAWTVKIGDGFPGDIGVVVALLLNHVSLSPGQAIFLQAGNLHSYLHGVGIELMANSDNVLRGGLTSKHIDVDELLDVVDYSPAEAPVQTPTGPVHRFESPVPEFSLTKLGVLSSAQRPDGDSFEATEFSSPGPSIVLVTSGRATVETSKGSIDLAGGDAAFIGAADGRFEIIDGTPGETLAWVATVGYG